MNEDVQTAAAPAAVSDEAPKHEESAVSATLQEHKPKAKPSAEERISELTALRKAAETERDSERQAREAAEKELEDWRSGRKRAEEKKPEPAKKEPPERPNLRTWTGTQEEFDAAMDEWQGLRDAQIRAATLAEQVQAENKRSMGEMMQRMTAKHPDAEQQIKSAAAIIMAKAPAFVQVFVNESDAIGPLLYKLSDATTLSNLLETSKTNPGKALRILRDMELDALSKSTEPKTEGRPEEKAPEVRPRAPKPPSEVGGRGAATEDAATAAARDGNFGAFEAEQKRRHFR
jgi:hypothetical protein